MKRIATLLIACVALLSGCAIQQMKKDNAETTERIDQKQRLLAAEQDNYRRLVTERDRLKADLARSEYTAAAMRTQLEQMSRLNDATPSATPEQRAAKAERAKRLDEAQRETAAVEKDNSKSRAEKQKQLDALKAKTRAMMDVLLQG